MDYLRIHLTMQLTLLNDTWTMIVGGGGQSLFTNYLKLKDQKKKKNSGQQQPVVATSC